MKKPKIRFIPYEGFAVKKSSGEFLDDDVTAEAYEEMIDALIEAKINISDMVDDFNNGELIRRIEHDRDTTIESIDKALKKAGVE